MKTIILSIVACFLFAQPSRAAVNVDAPSLRTHLLIDSGWAFHPDDPSLGDSPAQTDFDDSKWRIVQAPHDFVVEGKIDSAQGSGHGARAHGAAWYRRVVQLTPQDRGKTISIDFDGVYRDSRVWLNGQFLGEHKSGYTSFSYDVTRIIRPGQKNVLAVRVDASADEGWWYEGGGIYRHVWLTATDPVHIARWGVFVTSRVQGIHGAIADQADIKIETAVDDDTGKNISATLVTRIFAPGDALVANATTPISLTPGAGQRTVQEVRVPGAQLWSVDSPALYKCTSMIVIDGAATDQIDTPFGIRTLRFDPDKGFFLNDRHVEIKGVCIHQDFAGVGIALPDNLQEYRVRLLKSLGANAIRTAHNPPAPELLDACDRLGMLALDENRHLGDSFSPKTPSGARYDDMSELDAMAARDRNHPSVFLWSLCNEEPLQDSAEGARILAAMKQEIDRLDGTRPVTAAMNGGWGRGFSDVVDVQGCNYRPRDYAAYHKQRPDQPMIATETSSAVSDRGVYETVPGSYVDSYDTNVGGSWASTAEDAWRSVAGAPFVAGCFVWTGFDYRGEPLPYDWPDVSSHFGILDLCGLPKDIAYYYRAVWSDQPIVHILPHWNWAGQEGKPVRVWAYSNAKRVDLRLNGRDLGIRDVPFAGHAEWMVPYAAGTLTATALDASGKPVATDAATTTGAPAKIKLSCAVSTLRANGEDEAVIDAAVTDANGLVAPTASNPVTFVVVGPADIAGVGNGDPASREPELAQSRSAFNGRCVAIVRARFIPGTIRVIAISPGLARDTLVLGATPVPHPKQNFRPNR